jgi:hypothetical protein
MGVARDIRTRFGRMVPAEQLAAVGAVIVLGSLLLPWYGLKLIAHLTKTGLDSFGWGHAALVLTAGSALFLLSVSARGYRLPRPLAEGPLLMLAGAWCALLGVYLILDRPDNFDPLKVTLRFGIFVPFIGAAAMVLGGLGVGRVRRREREREVQP